MAFILSFTVFYDPIWDRVDNHEIMPAARRMYCSPNAAKNLRMSTMRGN